MIKLPTNAIPETNSQQSHFTSNGMKEISGYKHLFFDLDDTLTLSKSLIEPELRALLEQSRKTIVVVSGQEIAHIAKQTDNLKSIKLGQNGNFALDEKSNLLWKEEMTRKEKDTVLSHVSRMQPYVDWDVKDPSDLIEDRGCQVSYSLVGHGEYVPYKKAFDPNSERRLRLLQLAPFEANTVEVKIGGTTCFDYFKKGFHKGFNVTKLINLMGWNKEDCVYFGDKLHPGGNDETVVGVIDTVAVKDHRETYEKLRGSILKR